jgi:putative cell wall-binding protein
VPRFVPCVLLLAALALSGCSLKDSSDDSGSANGNFAAAPVAGAKSSDKNAVEQLGFPITATRNTTRVAGSDAVADAAGVASALFPSADPTSRPPAVVLADKGDWQAIVASGQLAAAPVRAPTLLTDGDNIPAVTQQTLDRLQPKGITEPSPAQAILVGDRPPAPSKLKSTVIKGGDPYTLSAAVDHFASVARGKPSPDVIVASGEKPEYSVPAAPYAANSGDAVLFVKRDEIPAPTKTALTQHQKPRIFVLGPPSAVSDNVLRQLKAFGKVTRIGKEGAVENSIEFASKKVGSFGWGPIAPGGNYTVANQSRPGDAAAAGGLGANGIFAPLLLVDTAQPLPRAVEAFFLDVQPGYYAGTNPRDAVFNHVWILGGTDAIGAQAQDRLDSVAALVTIDKPAK